MKRTRTDLVNESERPTCLFAINDRTLLTAAEECRLAESIAQGDFECAEPAG